MKKLLMTMMLASFSISAFALPMAQRNCSPDDLQIGYGNTPETHCEWLAKNDAPLQVTLHAQKGIPLVNATCIFTPSPSAENQQVDAVRDVIGHKAATVKNLLIRNNVVKFEVYNDNSDPNLNVIFYLNKTDNTYTAGDKIHCIFSAA